jgi:hypothetical protein
MPPEMPPAIYPAVRQIGDCCRAVIALAGRRVDPDEAAVPRFPISQLDGVREEIRRTLQAVRAGLLVAAAACGADLIALEVAGELGIRRRVVLPDHPARFRTASVIDRPGDWGPVFDRIVAAVEENGDLVVIGPPATRRKTDYLQTNFDILDEAARLAEAEQLSLLAVVIWDGKSRGPDDVTAHFQAEATRRSIPVIEILTIPHSS